VLNAGPLWHGVCPSGHPGQLLYCTALLSVSATVTLPRVSQLQIKAPFSLRSSELVSQLSLYQTWACHSSVTVSDACPRVQVSDLVYHVSLARGTAEGRGRRGEGHRAEPQQHPQAETQGEGKL